MPVNMPSRLATIGLLIAAAASAPAQDAARDETPLPTGRIITPMGRQTNVGSFPCNMVLSPDGKYIVVSSSGFREYLSVLSVDDGHLVSQLDFNAPLKGTPEKQTLYYGLAWSHTAIPLLYVSRGDEQTVSQYILTTDGKLEQAGEPRSLASPNAVGKNSRVPPTVEVAGIDQF